MSSLSRRALLRSATMASIGGLVLSACSPDNTTDPSELADDEIDANQEIIDAIRAAGFADLIADYQPIVATFEVITGPGRRLQFGLLDETQAPAIDRKVEIAIVRSGDLEVVQRTKDPLFYGEGLGLRGVYVVDTDLPSPAIHYLVVASEGHVGAAPIAVNSPENSQVVLPGQPVPVVASPTLADDQGLEELCTRTPACSMHQTSLDTALEAGSPVVLVVATPKFCQTAVCSPVVDVVQDLATSGDADNVTFIHAEVFSDAGNTPIQLVTDFGLPSEPWTFLIGSDGTLVDRFDGPVVPSLLRDAVLGLS
ncbi:MAG: hypothetical protein ACI867_000561 [Glaciecola sp.]|jgi:hypothetical protein